MSEQGQEYRVRATSEKRPVMWQEGRLLGPDFTAVATLVKRHGNYHVHLHLGTSHHKVQLHTSYVIEAKDRVEELYDMVCEAIDERAQAASTGFMLRSEVDITDSQDS